MTCSICGKTMYHIGYEEWECLCGYHKEVKHND